VAATATALVLVSSAVVLGMPTTAGAVNGFPVSGESPVAVRVADGGGIFVVGSEGEVATYGDATYYGGANLATPPAPISGIATTAPNLSTTSNPKGYWLSGRDGSVYNQPSGTVQFFGSLPSLHITPSAPIVGIAGTPDAKGYWLVGADGGIFAFGDAAFYGSKGGSPLNAPVVGMAATPDGKGYWLVASDGGIFAYGDAAFYGSKGGSPLNAPVVGMAATPDGKGYWLVASDGGIFAYGDATFYGSMGGSPLNAPVVGMSSSVSGHGYWLVASDGGLFAFGDAASLPYRGRVLSAVEKNSGASVNRDCGFSRKLQSGSELWLFCDTAVQTGTWGTPTQQLAGNSFATAPPAVAGASPTTLVDGTNGSGGLVNYLPPAADPTCTAAGGTPRSWPSGTAAVPNSPDVIVSYDNACLQGSNLLPGGWGVLVHNTQTGAWSATTSASMWQVPSSGDTWIDLKSPVIDSAGNVDFFGYSSLGLYLARVPAGSVTSPSSYQWWDGTAQVNSWTTNPASALPLPGTTSLFEIEGASVDNFQSVLPAGGQGQYVAALSTFLAGPYSVLRSPDLIHWAIDTAWANSGIATLTGCGHPSGNVPLQWYCRAATVHPEYSTSSQLAISWYSTSDQHVRMTFVPY
jgi:hypothetical protein